VPSEAYERWLAISEQFPIGQKKRFGVLRSAEPTNKVAIGQIRQAYWRDADAPVLITEIDDTTAQAHVFPVSLEPGVESTSAIVIDVAASPLHGPVVVWPTNAHWIPFSTLDSVIASIPTSLLRALQTKEKLDVSGLRSGQLEPTMDSGASLAIDDLFDALDVLENAPKLETQDPTTEPRKLRASLSLIVSTLRVSQPRAMAILMGKEPLALEEASQLAAAIGLPVEIIMESVMPLPRELLRELQEPRLRAYIRKSAHDGDEDLARTRLGYEAYQLAARETGNGRELWRQRLETVLASNGYA
jgi:hypothetical protein